jgi:hypothetical protein
MASAAGRATAPFRASYAGTCTISGTAPILNVSCTATGHGTHVGKSSEVVNLTQNLTTTPCPSAAGTGTLTAANGDHLIVTTGGPTCPAQSGLVAISGTQTITGGTGRFAGASGTLTITGTVNPTTGATSYTLEGAITRQT